MAHPIAVTAEANKEKALELRIAGNSYAQIAKALGVGISSAHRYVTESLDELREHSRDLAEEARRLELSRLDEMARTLWPKRENKGVADTIIKIGERRSKLLGLDAPVDMRFAGIPGGMPIPSGPTLDVAKMSTAELSTLEDFYERYGARPTEEPKVIASPGLTVPEKCPTCQGTGRDEWNYACGTCKPSDATIDPNERLGR